MSPPLVSMSLTVNNGEDFLAEAIECVLHQTHRPIELIVVDDGSTDRSADIAAGYGSPVEVIRRPHGGISAARNVVLERFRGDYLGSIDADDRMHPEAVERMLRAFAADPSLDAVFHRTVEFVSDGVDPEPFADRNVGVPRPGVLQSHCLIRRALVERVGPYDETMVRASGAEWMTRLHDLSPSCITLDDVLSERRLHTDNHGLRHPERTADLLTVARRQIERHRRAASE